MHAWNGIVKALRIPLSLCLSSGVTVTLMHADQISWGLQVPEISLRLD